MRVVNTAYCVKVFLTLIYILRERIEVFLLYEVLPSLLWWGMGCLVWKPELWGKMSSVITFKERGFYLKRARDKRGECVCTLSWHCQRLLWWNRRLMDGQRWSRLDQQTVWGAGRRQNALRGPCVKTTRLQSLLKERRSSMLTHRRHLLFTFWIWGNCLFRRRFWNTWSLVKCFQLCKEGGCVCVWVCVCVKRFVFVNC